MSRRRQLMRKRGLRRWPCKAQTYNHRTLNRTSPLFLTVSPWGKETQKRFFRPIPKSVTPPSPYDTFRTKITFCQNIRLLKAKNRFLDRFRKFRLSPPPLYRIWSKKKLSFSEPAKECSEEPLLCWHAHQFKAVHCPRTQTWQQLVGSAYYVPTRHM